jgi:hypothetical protein
MGNEWITINKDVFDFEQYESDNVFKVFLYFITHAATQPKIVKGQRLERGQLLVTREAVCEATKMTVQNYRTAVCYLSGSNNQTTNKSTQRITIKSTKRFTIITICEFDSYVYSNNAYQPTNQPTNQPTKQPINNQQIPIPPNPPKNPPFIQKEKENEKESSPTPPKEKEKEKEKASPQPSLRKKEKHKPLVCLKTKESGSSFSSVAGATSDEPKDLRGEIERKKKNMEGRRVNFYNSLVPFVQMYGKVTVRNFFDYWSEPNKSGTQMRYELERTWSLSLRLAFWSRKEKSYVRKSATDEKREANAAVIERLREDALRRLRPMDEEEPLPI